MEIQTCPSCVNSYDGADGVLRCRVHSNGLKCSQESADGCKRYQYQPGTDVFDREDACSWIIGCQGRGD